VSCRLIVNADDFGWSEGVNEAVCALYDEGIVTSTSLLVGAPAAREARSRLRSRPGLAVGLHLAGVHAPALLPREVIPRLADRDGELETRCLPAALRCTLLPSVREELARELEAQAKAFDGLGLGWSHVDSHLHFTLVPGVFRMALDLCKRYPVLGFRVPQDDFRLYARMAPADALRQSLFALAFEALCRGQRKKVRAAGLRVTDRCYGLFRTGRLDADYLSRLVREMPDGDLELHCHPDLSTEHGRREFEALRSPGFREALRQRGVVLSTYASLAS
jgi:hopanoid biosynthesis associated protein HpnK